ncbi:hypothetical protein PC9H_006343 [Pleurotus ostreatus]|uniref:Galactose oxidase n=1 Tax=Pleurotus ostreatus TaxID=5322 RepID=A0A8H6ZTY3_PLEOS|nr:uncharacterized protein PC9H_006343 [Pleurotus ostreatus]KAF7430634.1 hypothetical protein PC9H_006343 [Pleurotus ostreatus]KAJ8694951.1 hypothetical protein PTI98_007582 [Pleurotus ostreatus]
MSMSLSIAGLNPSLSDVPEVEETSADGSSSGAGDRANTINSPYLGSPTPSTSSFNVPAVQVSRSSSNPGATGGISRKASSIRTLGKSSSSSMDIVGYGSGSTPPTSSLSGSTSSLSSSTATLKRKPSSSSQSRSAASPQPPHSPKPGSSAHTLQKYRSNPRLPNDKECARVPSTMMYWSRAPVYGAIPMRTFRAHTVTLVDNVAWLFGGCDDKDCWKDIYLFDTETMQWSHPDTTGDTPPPCRAHTATLVDRKLFIFGGGQGPTYYNTTFILDVNTRRWSKLPMPKVKNSSNLAIKSGKEDSSTNEVSKDGSKTNNGVDDSSEELEYRVPAPRRAHTAVFFAGRVWIFGGGNGMTALNDVWTLDVARGGDGNDGGGNSSSTKGSATASSSSSYSHLRWEEVQTVGRKPTPRGYHTANLVGDVMVVVGGSDGKECFSDIWCLNLITLVWSQVKLQIAHRRLSHSATQVGSYLYILGGHDGNEYRSDLLLFNLVSLQYESRPVAGKGPSARGYHVSLLADSRIFLFGGYNGHNAFDDVHILDLAAAAYLPQVTSFTIEA